MKRIITGSLILLSLFSCKEKNNVDPEPDNTFNKDEVIAEIRQQLESSTELSHFSSFLSRLELTKENTEQGITILVPDSSLLPTPTRNSIALPDGAKVEEYILQGTSDLLAQSDGQKVMTISGASLTISRIDDMVFVNGIRVEAAETQVNGKNFKVYTLKNLLYHDAYHDPHAEEYFIEYFENGCYRKVGTTISSWSFPIADYPILTFSKCAIPQFNTSIVSNPGRMGGSGGVSLQQIFSAAFYRNNAEDIPKVKTYRSERKEMSLTINGAMYNCDISDSYYNFSISEVVIDANLDGSKFGYYAGEFEAILYFSPSIFSENERKTITTGKFKLPIGNYGTPQFQGVPLNGKGNPSDCNSSKLELLTQGKWQLDSTVSEGETYYNDNKDCGSDDFLTFSIDGTLKLHQNKIICNDPDAIGYYSQNRRWWVDESQRFIYYDGHFYLEEEYYVGKAEWIATSEKLIIKTVAVDGEALDAPIEEHFSNISNFNGSVARKQTQPGFPQLKTAIRKGILGIK